MYIYTSHAQSHLQDIHIRRHDFNTVTHRPSINTVTQIETPCRHTGTSKTVTHTHTPPRQSSWHPSYSGSCCSPWGIQIWVRVRQLTSREKMSRPFHTPAWRGIGGGGMGECYVRVYVMRDVRLSSCGTWRTGTLDHKDRRRMGKRGGWVKEKRGERGERKGKGVSLSLSLTHTHTHTPCVSRGTEGDGNCQIHLFFAHSGFSTTKICPWHSQRFFSHFP